MREENRRRRRRTRIEEEGGNLLRMMRRSKHRKGTKQGKPAPLKFATLQPLAGRR